MSEQAQRPGDWKDPLVRKLLFVGGLVVLLLLPIEWIRGLIAEGKLPEHPTYEDYLEALAHIDTMKSSLEDLRRILGALEMELPT